MMQRISRQTLPKRPTTPLEPESEKLRFSCSNSDSSSSDGARKPSQFRAPNGNVSPYQEVSFETLLIWVLERYKRDSKPGGLPEEALLFRSDGELESQDCKIDRMLLNARAKEPSNDMNDTGSKRCALRFTGRSPLCEKNEDSSDSGSLTSISANLEQHTNLAHNFRHLMGIQCQSTSQLVATVFKFWCEEARNLARPQSFELRTCWITTPLDLPDEGCAFSVSATHSLNQYKSIGERLKRKASSVSRVVKSGEKQERTLKPSSTFRTMWDILGFVMLTHDLITIPLCAFEEEFTLAPGVMEVTVLMYWTFDMWASTLTGYSEKGVIVMDRKLIISKYLRSWFIFDLFINMPDWIVILLLITNGTNVSKTGHLILAVRFCRLFRLLRLSKMHRLNRVVRDKIDSELAFIIINIHLLIACLVMVNHCVASVWYSVGRHALENGEPAWVEEAFTDEPSKFSVMFRYTTSLHWSVAQFTPGSTKIEPCNLTERSFAVLVLLFGLVCFSSFVSSITAAVAQLKSMQEDKTKQFWLLRRYLKINGVDTGLCHRVLQYADYACREKKLQVAHSKIWILDLLSDQLRGEVLFQVSYASLKYHAMFRRLSRLTHGGVLCDIVQSSLVLNVLARDDTLFRPRILCTRMFSIDFGEFLYAPVSAIYREDATMVHSGMCLAEAALWVCWRHVGRSTANTEGRVICVDADKFATAVKEDTMAHAIARCCATKFSAWVSQLPGRDLTDLQMKDPEEHFDDTPFEPRGCNSKKVKPHV